MTRSLIPFALLLALLAPLAAAKPPPAPSSPLSVTDAMIISPDGFPIPDGSMYQVVGLLGNSSNEQVTVSAEVLLTFASADDDRHRLVDQETVTIGANSTRLHVSGQITATSSGPRYDLLGLRALLLGTKGKKQISAEDTEPYAVSP